MPTFEITSPDGRRFRVTAPDGATQDQVLAYVQQSTSPKRSAAELGAEQTAAEYGPLGAGVVAAGRTLDRLYQGGKQLALQVPSALGSDRAKAELARNPQDEATDVGPIITESATKRAEARVARPIDARAAGNRDRSRNVRLGRAGDAVFMSHRSDAFGLVGPSA